jgi:hypothetical protein
MSVRCSVDEVQLLGYDNDHSIGFHIDVMGDTLSNCKFLAGNIGCSLEALIASMIVNSAEQFTNAVYGEGGLSGNPN